jgi:uncharacterized membrane protein YfcA
VIVDSYLLLTAIIILAIAFAFSPLGLGGGVLYMPVFHYLAGWSLPEAILGSLTMVWMVALGSSLAHTKGGHADKEVANAARMTAVPSAIIGTIIAWLIISYISGMLIKAFAAVILIFVIERNLRPRNDIIPDAANLRLYKKGAAFGGLASGVLGVGGGAIYVTLNRRLLGMDVHKSSGTSYLIGAAVIPVAIISHVIIDQSHTIVYGNVGLLATIAMPISTFIAAYIGGRFAVRYLSEKIIRAIFMIAISATLLRYLWDIASNIL